MAKVHFNNVAEYISAQSPNVQIVLERIQRTIRKALPDAEEVISYNIPAYSLQENIVLYFAGWKQHYSLYPAGERLLAAFKDQLADYDVGKGTIRFPLSKPVPIDLIAQIAKFRAMEVGRRETLRQAEVKEGSKKPAH